MTVPAMGNLTPLDERCTSDPGALALHSLLGAERLVCGRFALLQPTQAAVSAGVGSVLARLRVLAELGGEHQLAAAWVPANREAMRA